MTTFIIPSARQPVTQIDATGNASFTRPWFLFFQTLFERVGGANGPSTDDIVDSFVDSTNPETDAALYSLANELRSEPLTQPDISGNPDTGSMLAALIDEVAELKKAIQALQQGTSL